MLGEPMRHGLWFACVLFAGCAPAPSTTTPKLSEFRRGPVLSTEPKRTEAEPPRELTADYVVTPERLVQELWENGIKADLRYKDKVVQFQNVPVQINKRPSGEHTIDPGPHPG